MKVTITIEEDVPTVGELAEFLRRVGPPRRFPPAADNDNAAEMIRPGPLEDLVRAERAEQPPARQEAIRRQAVSKICRSCKREFLTTSSTKVLCDACFFAESAVARDLRPERKRKRADRSEKRYIMPGVKHGTAHSYKKGCRCWPCTDAKAADQRDYEERRKAAHA